MPVDCVSLRRQRAGNVWHVDLIGFGASNRDGRLHTKAGGCGPEVGGRGKTLASAMGTHEQYVSRHLVLLMIARIGPNHKPRPTARTLTARLSEGWPSVTSPSSTSAVAASSTSVSSCPWIRLNSSGRTRPPMSPTGDRHADDQWEWQLKEEDANERGGSDGEHDRVLDDAPSDSQNSAGNNGNHGCRNAKEQSRHPREVAVRRKQDAQHHDRKEPRQDEERTSEKPTRWPSQ
ncbi:hypothetical protein GQR58_028509 [Nymphon striatum]|nr:hypothetical protein GQR58_028509 [Nymphon striatum]